EALAERLDDNGRRARVYAYMVNPLSLLGELDEALALGARALAIAQAQKAPELRILTTMSLELTHYYRGDYERVVEIATDNLALLPANRGYDDGRPPSWIHDRVWLAISLARLGRFQEAAGPAAEAIRLAEPTERPFSIANAHRGAGTVALFNGHWAMARSHFERAIAMLQMGNVLLMRPFAVASSAWVLAQLGEEAEAVNRMREAEEFLRQAFVADRDWIYHTLGRASLLLGRLDEAQRLADRAVEHSRRQPGFTADALHLLGDIATHPDH